ncbi:MAG: DUF3095 family protein [Saprospiraceae bacterium]|nr:DUF3095 family protein [Saprospiraceae bacterium]
MVPLSDSQFYGQLPISNLPLSVLLTHTDDFRSVPSSWYVVITDIVNSTRGISEGRHQEINLIATGSIIAVLNLAAKHATSIPFFFGGDGATFLIPKELHKPVLRSLEIHRENTLRNFELELRVGSMQVADLENYGNQFRIARFRVNEQLYIPIVLGGGLREVERIIKSRVSNSTPEAGHTLDLSGMECRWDRIRPPQHKDEVVALLVDATNLDTSGLVFSQVVKLIEEVYGPFASRHPISATKLHIKSSLGTIKTEMQVKLGGFDLMYLIKNWLYTLIGKTYYGREENSRNYMQALVQLSDILVIDGRINTIISGTNNQRIQLINRLAQLEEDGKILFGYHTSEESIMSCYVRNRKDQHLHFIDGGDGGYTQASKMLKKKIKA